MQRIQDPTASTTLVGPPSLTGPVGYFQPANPGITLATRFRYWYATMLQEELMAFLTKTGITPDTTATEFNQVLAAVEQIAGANVATITATGALTSAQAGVVLVNATSGNIAITLPLAAAANGLPTEFTFVRTDATGNTVSIALAGGDTPLLFASPVPLVVNGVMTLRADGVSKWAMLSRPPRWRQVFSTSGTLVVPNYTKLINAVAIGGGSGATGCSTSVFAGACGGGGGWAVGQFTVTPGASYTVTIGAGGAGSAAGVASSAGGSTSLGALLSATGGQAAGTSTNAGGMGGAGSGGDYQGNGGDGSDGMTSATLANWPGVSGGSLFGGSRRCGSDAGFGGSAPGAGGSAPYSQPSTTTNGNPGAAGIVIVEGF